MATDDDRRELFDLLEAGLGTRGAGLLMAQLPPVGWTELATKSDIAALRSELGADMSNLRSELKTDMADLRSDMTTEMARLRIDVTNELNTRLAGLVPRLWAANVATMIGLSGLVFAVATFGR